MFRRCFLTLALVLGLGVVGCGGSSDSGTTASGGGASTEPTPVPKLAEPTAEVDNVRWNLPLGEPQTLDAGKILNYGDLEIHSNMCEPLEFLMPDGSREPGLATSIDSPDDKTYVINVRQGVKFWDGAELTAEDVAFSMNRVLDPANASFYAGMGSNVKSIEPTGKYEVTVKMSQPDPIYREALVTPLGMVTQKAYTEQKGDSYGSPQGGVMCTGPYEFQSWTPGTDIKVKRNPNWWNADSRKQWPKAATFTFVGDVQTMTSGLTNGEIDGMFDVPPSALTTLESSSAGQLLSGPSTQVLAFSAFSQEGTIGNLKIRQALTKLIDYEGFVTSQYNGLAQPAKALMGPNSWVGAEDVYRTAFEKIPEAEYNVDEAAKLVQQSGIKNPVVRIAVFAGLPQEAALAEQMQSAGKEAGIDIQFDNLPLAEVTTLFVSEEARSKYDLFLQFSAADVPEALQFYESVGIKDGINNFSGWTTPGVTRDLEQAAVTEDPQKRADLTVKAQTVITEQLPWIPAVFPAFTSFTSSNLVGAPTSFPSVAYTSWLPDVGAK